MSNTVFALKSDDSGVAVERHKRILCADYDEDNREMMALFLEIYGYEVTTSGSLAETLMLIGKGGFDLLLLDDWYPDGRGVDLCSRIHAFDGQTPIVLLSAYARQADINKAMEAGAQAYIVKPFDFDVLTQTIERIAL